jgi:hypothetical protein
MKNIEFVLSLVGAIIVTFVIAIWVPGKPADKLAYAFAYAALVIIFLFGFMVLAAIASGKIDISKLLEEHGGGASMSRFQLLIFIFVIGLSFFYLVLCGNCKFPDVPANVLVLLGISASTYGVSKGIQATSDAPPKGTPPSEKKG